MASVSPEASQVAPRRRWRGAGWLLAALLLLIAAPVLTLLSLWHAEATLPWGLGQVPGLTTQGVRGSLASGQIEIDQLDWALPGDAGQLQLRGLRLQGLRWTWGTRPTLHMAQAHARQLVYHSGPPSTAVPKAPTDLHLPISLAIQSLQVDSTQIDALPPLRDLKARVALGANGGALHRIDGLTVNWEQARLAGELQLGAGGTLPLMARLQASSLGARRWQADARADGPLARFALTLAAEGEAREGHPAPAVQAQATLTPFAGWPLAALNLTTRQLDLAALSARLPQTALSGSAEVQSSGLDRPASAKVQLDNAQPGRFDEARLPLRRLLLNLAGEPRHTDRLDLQQFELTLADGQAGAGTLRGSGRWQGERLDLALQLDALQPARLDGRAAPIRLGGPLTLQVTGLPMTGTAAPSAAGAASAAGPAGPHFAVQGQLAGQALDGSGPPVQLKLSLEGDAQRWQLHQAEASTGAARASAKGDAQREAAGWRIGLQTQLTQFDPLPWWRGQADSPWRRGPHRLSGQAEARLLWRDGPTPPAPTATTARAASAGRAGSAASSTATAQWPRWLQALAGELKLTLADSQLAGVPVAGHLVMTQGEGGTQLEAHLQAAGNQLDTEAQLSADGGHQRGHLQVGAPALAALAPLWRLLGDVVPEAAPWLPSAGTLEAVADVNGRWPAWRSSGKLSARGLRSPQATLAQADVAWSSGDSAEQPLALKLTARGLRVGGSPSDPAPAGATAPVPPAGALPGAAPNTTPNATPTPAPKPAPNIAQQLDRLDLELSGSLARHTLHLVADSPLKPPGWTENLLGPTGSGTRFEADLRGEWRAQAGGSQWRLQNLTLRGGARDAAAGTRPWLTATDLTGELELDRQSVPVALQFAAGRVQLLSAALRWRDVRWQAAPASAPSASKLELAAELESVDVASWLQRLQPGMGWSGDLSISGRVDIRLAERVDADIVLERTGGDLAITDDLGNRQALGLTDLRLALGVHDGLWQFAQGLAGRQVGEIAGAQVIRTTPERRWPAPDAPMQGVLQARVANLGIWGAWVPPGWRLAGNLQTTASLGGKFNAPELRGEMRGSGLGVRNLLQGVNLSEGELAITLSGEQAQIERFSFRGGDGRLTVTGGAMLGDAPALSLRLDADHFRLLGRIDRRVVASGQVDVRLAPARLQVDGQIQLDEGLVDLSHADAPSLDGDVQVHRNGNASASASASVPGAAASAPTVAPPPAWRGTADVAVRINLGDKLQLRGRGIDTGLKGELRVTSPGNKLALNGSVRTSGGTYAAYGQKLEITRGELTFSGSMDNPRLDVLAVRPNLDVVVGVSVVGTAQNPRIRLTSEPEMAEFDKLSWLVLGRSPDGLGRTDTALLQRAAVALLAGGEGKAPTDALIESLGLTDFSLRQTEGDVRETIVSLGRQLSRRWYVGYERSVNATTGTWQLIYRVAQRFTLRAQSGGENSVDLIWSWRW